MLKTRAIIFDGLDFGQVFFLLMGKKYDVLAQHMVNVNGAFADDNDAIALLRRRTQRIEAPAVKKPDVTRKVSGGCGNCLIYSSEI